MYEKNKCILYTSYLTKSHVLSFPLIIGCFAGLNRIKQDFFGVDPSPNCRSSRHLDRPPAVAAVVRRVPVGVVGSVFVCNDAGVKLKNQLVYKLNN